MPAEDTNVGRMDLGGAGDFPGNIAMPQLRAIATTKIYDMLGKSFGAGTQTVLQVLMMIIDQTLFDRDPWPNFELIFRRQSQPGGGQRFDMDMEDIGRRVHEVDEFAGGV